MENKRTELAASDMTPTEAVEVKICVQCRQQVDSFDAVENIYCMMDYLDTGLCATCRKQLGETVVAAPEASQPHNPQGGIFLKT